MWDTIGERLREKPKTKGNMGFETSKIRVKESKSVDSNRRMFSVESDIDSGRSIERGKMRIVKTVVLNGKTFNVVAFS